MSDEKEAKGFELKGHKLVCPICGSTQFWTRRTLLNTKGLTFMDLDWLNKEADNYICNTCGYIMWFLPKEG
ncbi:MAG: hypothetical protein PHR28_07445 [candidate division Zixibacteria bacterium]|nr:hypothetical protein [candidate division Zixibacteria bacterium]